MEDGGWNEDELAEMMADADNKASKPQSKASSVAIVPSTWNSRSPWFKPVGSSFHAPSPPSNISAAQSMQSAMALQAEIAAIPALGGVKEAWYCLACGFRNQAKNDICGGNGSVGCKTPKLQPGFPAAQMKVDWICDCGWRNRAMNDVCGGHSPTMGCKAARPQGELDPTGGTIDPEVAELIEYFKIEECLGRQLTVLLYKRPESSEDDLRRLWDQMLNFTNPAALLCVKMKEMREGTFLGLKPPGDDLNKMCKKYKLDDIAMRKLEDVLNGGSEGAGTRPVTREDDLAQLEKHLELSNNPSKYVMMLLKKIRGGEKLGDPTWDAAVGSHKHRMMMSARQKDGEKDGKDGGDKDGRDRRSRSRSRRDRDRDARDNRRDSRDRGGRERENYRDERDRERDRGRDRERDREGNRDGGRDDRGRRDDDRGRRSDGWRDGWGEASWHKDRNG